MSPRAPRDPGRLRAGAAAAPVVTARSALDVVAAVPFLLGFVPTSSLVLLSLRGPRLRVGTAARTDLPVDDLPHDALTAAIADQAVSPLLRDEASRIMALVYDDRPWTREQPPRRAMLDAVVARLAGSGVPLHGGIYVTAERYWSYGCDQARCCPPEGRCVAAAATSEVAAAFVLQGRSPYRSRQQLAMLVEPAPGARPAAVARLARQLRPGAALGAPTQERDRVGELRRGLRELDDVIGRYVDAGPAMSDHEAARMLLLLRDTDARDVAMIRWTGWVEAMSSAPPGLDGPLRDLLSTAGKRGGRPTLPDPGDRDVSAAVQRFLFELCSLATGRPALSPLVLLACHAWADGDGGLAGIAVDRALAIDPRHRMATLVDALLRAGIPPQWVTAARAGG